MDPEPVGPQPAWDELVGGLLARELDERYGSAAELDELAASGPRDPPSRR